MSQEQPRKDQYDVASISRAGQDKRANYVREAMFMERSHKSTGQFVKVFADMFLKHEAGRKSYV